MQTAKSHHSQQGFSLIELVIGIAITLMLTGVASMLLGSAFKIRMRENQKNDALADARRVSPFWSKTVALISTVLWAGVGVGGRWIGFS